MPNDAMSRTRWVRALRASVSILAVGLLLHFGVQAFGQVSSDDFQQVGWGLLGAFVIACVYRVTNAFGWGLILGSLGYRVPSRSAARVWLLSESMRWLPGSVWNLASRAHQARRLGVPLGVATVSLPVEYALTASAWLAVAIGCGVYTGTMDPLMATVTEFVSWKPIIVLVLVGLLAVKIAGKKAVQLVRSMHRDWILAEVNSGFGSLGRLLVVLVLYGILCLLHGLGKAVIVSAFTEGDSLVWQVVGANALAWIVGFFVPLAPSGVGVREGAMCIALGPFMPIEVAAMCALLWRLVQIASELVIVTPLAYLHISAGTMVEAALPVDSHE